MALFVTLALLVQPLCAPICAARNCGAEMRDGAMHCGAEEGGPEEVSASPSQPSCSSSDLREALPAPAGGHPRRIEGHVNAAPSAMLIASVSAMEPCPEGALPIAPSSVPNSRTGASAVLRV